MTRRFATLPVVLALLLGVRTIQKDPPARTAAVPESPGSSSPNAGGRTTAAAPTQTAKTFPDGARLLAAFLLGAEPRPLASAGGDAAADDSMQAAGSPAVAPAKSCLPPVGILVATLPDPTDSHLDWAFDSDFEAILRAYERAGYVIDRYWLPWSEKLDTTLASPGSASTRRLREVYPGVVLFRRDATLRLGGAARAALPAAAMRAAAMRAAAGRVDTAGGEPGDTAGATGASAAGAEAAEVTATAGADSVGAGPAGGQTAPCGSGPGSASARDADLQLLYVVGEVPTGGVHKEALQRALKERDDILLRSGRTDTLRIVGPSFSGSAASLGIVLRRCRAKHDEPVAVLTGSSTSNETGATLARVGRVSFGSTVHNDAALTDALVWRVLCPMGIYDDQVAILRESGTSYGRDAVYRGASQALACDDGRRMHPWRFMVIPFPMNIGSLRAEFEAHPQEPREGEARSRARLTLRDPDRVVDRPAPASQLTAPALEVVLDEIERAITEHRVRAVGILASDVRDKIFLATELRRRLGDVQLFTFEGNALYLVPENNAEFRGMLVLSSYPLTVQSQWWTPGLLNGMRLTFPNEGAAGIHNAVLMQLGADTLAVDYGPPFEDLTRRQPPVWVSAIGRREFVPVTVLDATRDSVIRSLGRDLPRPNEWPHIRFFAAVAVALLGVLLLWSAAPALPDRALQAVDPVEPPPEGPPPGSAAGGAGGSTRHPEPASMAVAAQDDGAPPKADEPSSSATAPARAAADATPPGAVPDTGGSGHPASPVPSRGAAEAGQASSDEGSAAVQRAYPVPAVPGTPPAARAPAPTRRSLAAARVAAAAGRPAEEVLDEVRRGSQNFHEHAYLTLRTLAWLSVFIPIAVVTAFALLRRSPFDGPGAGWRVLVVAWLLVVVVVGGWAAARQVGGAWARLRAVQPLGLWFARMVNSRSWWVEVVLRAVVLLGGAGFFALSLLLTWQIVKMRFTRRITFPLFVARAGVLDSGLSPLLPMLLAGAGFAVWCTWHVRRVRMLAHTTPFESAWDAGAAAPADEAGDEEAERRKATALPRVMERPVREIRMRLFKVVPDDRGIPVLVAAVALSAALAMQVGRTVDGMIGLSWFEWLLRLGISGALVAICWAVYRLLSVWRELDCFLGHLAETPLVPAFRRLPDRVGQLTRLTLWAPSSREVVDAVAGAQWRHLKQLTTLTVAEAQGLEASAPGTPALIAAYMDRPAPPASRSPRRLWGKKQDDSFVELNRILSRIWSAEPDLEIVKEMQEERKKAPYESTGALVRRSFPGAVRLWLRAAEEFAAVQVVDYIEWVLQQLRTLTLFLFISLLVTTALLSSYPYQAQSLAKLVFLFVLLLTVGALLSVMAALNRDSVLSLVAGTDPGRISWDRSFIVNALTVGVLPLLSLIGSALPEWHVFGWVSTLLGLFGGGGG
jgi:hypothetical protein